MNGTRMWAQSEHQLEIKDTSKTLTRAYQHFELYFL